MKEGIVSQIEAKFMSLDVDLDGKVNSSEMAKALNAMGLQWDEAKIEGLIKQMSDGKEVVRFNDFKPVLLDCANRHPDWTIDQDLRTAITNLAQKGAMNAA